MDFLSWFKATNVTDMIPADKFSDYKIDESYKFLTIYEFLQCCCTRNLSKPLNDSSSYLPANSNSLRYATCIYPISSILGLQVINDKDETGNYPFVPGKELNADIRLTSYSNSKQFYYDSEVKLAETLTGKDVPSKYTSNKNPVWTSIGTSGLNKTAALSLIDSNGVILPRLGSAGVIDINTIIWEDLVSVLNTNRSLDILGTNLRKLKYNIIDSGDNYLQLANGVRVYFSNTEPNGDIPPGSIGIGW